ncbi:MAG: farnesyl diphosphate synthase [Gammaproteobacteria bacterium]|nr:farnesyl diphosphate synthase [Gammaproteobacteria bacterium]
MTPTDFGALEAYATECRSRVEARLDALLPASTLLPTRLHEAMRYAVLGAGKRVRPLLVYATGHALGVPMDTLDAGACAVELIHAYSLVHDDLPAMDDDDLRRGRPTCHKAFDEGTAVLVGDALQSLAFQILAGNGNGQAALPSQTRLEMVSRLAIAAGSRGMAGGQAIDLDAVGQDLNLAELEIMHIHKTGALIRTAVLLGALAAGDGADAALEDRLDHYGKCIGLAFQIRDDILDVELSTEDLGKPQGADVQRNKPTYPAIVGLSEAKRIAEELHEAALESLSGLDERADHLRGLSAFIVRRGN